MPAWEACRIRVELDDGSPAFEDDDGEVRIEAGRIRVCYWDEAGAVIFDGHEREPGRFVCAARSRPRTAELVFDAGDRVLRGRFQEGELRGTLRIELPSVQRSS